MCCLGTGPDRERLEVASKGRVGTAYPRYLPKEKSIKSVWGFLLFTGVAFLLLGTLNYMLSRGRERIHIWADKLLPNRKRDPNSANSQMMRDYSEWWARAAIPIAVLGGLLAVIGVIGCQRPSRTPRRRP